MTSILLVLAAVAFALGFGFAMPLVAVGMIIPFTETAAVPVGQTNLRVLTVGAVILAVGARLAVGRRFGSRSLILQVASDRMTWLFGLLLTFFVVGRVPVEVFDRNSAKLFLLHSAGPIFCAALLISRGKDLAMLLLGIVVGATAQFAFEIPRWQEMMLLGALENTRLGLQTTGYSRMLFSGWMTVCVLVAVFAMLSRFSIKTRIIAVPVALCCFGALLFSGTRSGFASALIGLLALLTAMRHRMLALIAALGAAITTVLSMTVLETAMSVRLRDFITSPLDEAASRTVLWQQAVGEDLPRYWLLGTGLFRSGQVTSVVEWDRGLGSKVTDQFFRINYENIPIALLIELGVFGCAALLAMVVFLVRERIGQKLVLPGANSALIDLAPLTWALLLASATRCLFYGSTVGTTDLLLGILCLTRLGGRVPLASPSAPRRNLHGRVPRKAQLSG